MLSTLSLGAVHISRLMCKEETAQLCTACLSLCTVKSTLLTLSVSSAISPPALVADWHQCRGWILQLSQQRQRLAEDVKLLIDRGKTIMVCTLYLRCCMAYACINVTWHSSWRESVRECCRWCTSQPRILFQCRDHAADCGDQVWGGLNAVPC